MKKYLFLLAIALFCINNNPISSQEIDDVSTGLMISSDKTTKAISSPSKAPSKGTLITHCSDLTISPGSGIGCGSGYTSYIRVFDLANDFGFTQNVLIDTILFGISTANAQNWIVNLHTLTGPFLSANLTLLASDTVSLPTISNDYIYHLMPVELPIDSIIVLEIKSSYASTSLGINYSPQTDSSYFIAPDCSYNDITDISTVGLSGTSFIMAMYTNDLDAGISNLLPTEPVYEGQKIDFSVDISSYYAKPINTITINWAVDYGAGPILQTPFIYKDTINPFEKAGSIVFGNLLLTDTVTITAWLSDINGQPIDDNQNNDTITFQYNVLPIYSGTYPWIEDFESVDFNTYHWLHGNENDFNWGYNSGPTSSSNTGPESDHTTGTGYYIYTESSNPNFPDKLASIYSIPFVLTSLEAPVLEFWYHMRNDVEEMNMGHLHLDIKALNDNDWINDVFVRAGDKGNEWHKVKIDLSMYSNDTILLRFRGITGNYYTSDMALDDITIFDKPDTDIELVNWLYPTDIEYGMADSSVISLNIYNNGKDTIYTYTVSYSVDGGLTYSTSDTVNTTLLPGEEEVYTSTGYAQFPNYGIYDCKAYVSLVNDLNQSNDSTAQKVFSTEWIKSFPYTEDFEAVFPWGTTTANGGSNSWEIGEPEGTFIDTVPDSGGLNVWMTNLSGNYPDNEQSFIMTPAFDFTGMEEPWISFDLNYYTEATDYFFIEYSTNRGKTWKPAGTTSSGGINWFDNSTPYSWSGISNGWIKAYHPLNALKDNKEVIFKISFQSNASINYDGVAFDNIAIYDRTSDLSISWVSPETYGCSYSSTDSIKVLITNNGLEDVTGFTVYYSIDSNASSVSETVNETIEAGNSLLFTFSTTEDFSAVDTFYCFAWIETAGDYSKYNNKSEYTIINNSSTVVSLPIDEDWESGDFGNWIRSPQTGYMWFTDTAGTPSSNTGPTIDHTLGSTGGFYAYTEASNGSSRDIATISTPCFDLSGNYAELSYWYHMYGTAIINLSVDILVDNHWINGFQILSGQQQVNQTDPWLNTLIYLPNNTQKVRFKTTKGSSYEGDIAIDDISLSTSSYTDIGITSFVNVENYSLTNFAPQVSISNNGIGVSSFNVILEGPAYTDTVIVDSIEPNKNLTIEFDTIYLSTGSFDLLARINYAGDMNSTNDTLIITSMAEDVLTPAYCYSNNDLGLNRFYLEHPDDLTTLGSYSLTYLEGGDWIEGEWYAASYAAPSYLYKINKITGEYSFIGNLPNYIAGIVYDKATNNVYAISYYGSFYTIDISNGDVNKISPDIFGSYFSGLTCSPQGGLLTYNVYADSIVHINKSDGSMQNVFESSYINGGYNQDIAIDRNRDSLFLGATSSGTGYLYSMTLSDSSMTNIGTFEASTDIGALAIPYSSVEGTNFIGFSISEQQKKSFIDINNHTITIYVHPGEDISKTMPRFVLSENASASINGTTQISGSSIVDLTQSTIYLVSNGSASQTWTIIIEELGTEILSYSIPTETQPANIDRENRLITVYVNEGEPLSDIAASFSLSGGAIAKINGKIQTSGSTTNNYYLPLFYWIVNGNDSLQWTIKAIQSIPDGSEIVTYELPFQQSIEYYNDSCVIAVITEEGTNMGSLAATFLLSSGANAFVNSVHQVSGTTRNNFRHPVYYSVVSAGGFSKLWRIEAERLLYTGNNILEFKVPDQVGEEDISNEARTVTISIPEGTDLTNISPASVEVSEGASISPSETSAQDFSSGAVTYRVTSESGSSVDWNVTINDDAVPVNDLNINQKISVYPIPAKEVLNIKTNDASIRMFKILDITGRIVYNYKNNIINSVICVNTKRFTSGIYFLEIYTSEGVVKRKIEIIK